jgi:hypothetical protein
VVGINLAVCFVAACLGVACPVSCGSGIPSVKAYLNGINIPLLLRAKTFVHKTLGVISRWVPPLPRACLFMPHLGVVHLAWWAACQWARRAP